MNASEAQAAAAHVFSTETLLNYCRTVVRSDNDRLRQCTEEYAQWLRAQAARQQAA